MAQPIRDEPKERKGGRRKQTAMKQEELNRARREDEIREQKEMGAEMLRGAGRGGTPLKIAHAEACTWTERKEAEARRAARIKQSRTRKHAATVDRQATISWTEKARCYKMRSGAP